jgi:RimJ/RimL family protein N-acetyltransferase
MLKGRRVILRRVMEGDWKQIEEWAEAPDALFGAYQRFQLDLLAEMKEGYRKTGLLGPDSAILIIEQAEGKRPIGVVRYRPLGLPDEDLPVPEIGFAIAEEVARGKGYAKEAAGLLVQYLFDSSPTQRIMAVTSSENLPSQRVLEALGFKREGVLRRAMFRGGRWGDAFIYGLLREEFTGAS